MTTILKLGGSVVTEKDIPETVDEGSLRRAAEAVGDARNLVVVHGGGSFGHHHASERGVSRAAGTDSADAVRAIHSAMKQLNAAVVDALAAADTPAIPIHPLSVASRGSDGTLSLPARSIRSALAEGFVPVLHGDVVVHDGKGATILSGDELVVVLAEALSADRVGVCSAVPGVYDANGEVIERIRGFEDVADALGESDSTDVTGGMAGKVRELLGVTAPAFVFDLDELAAFVDGEEPGTRIG